MEDKPFWNLIKPNLLILFDELMQVDIHVFHNDKEPTLKEFNINEVNDKLAF